MKLIGKLITAVIISNLFVFNANAVEKKYHNIVQPIIKAFQSNNRELISTLVSYPLGRKFPILPVENKTDFIARYDELFDKDLIKLISQSNIDTDWKSVGWRGIMLSNGVLWLDADGKIRTINYESNFEKIYRQKLITKQKQSLHISVQNYEEPILKWKTKKFHIRIDSLENDQYRYSAWSINKKTNEKPSLILYKGERIFDGSGGNHRYIFKNEQFKYICNVSVLGATESVGNLEVYKNNKLLLSETVIESIY